MVCEAGNCGYHYFNFLYQPDSQWLLGYYFDGKGSAGKPDNEEASILTDGEIKTGPGETGTAPVATAPPALQNTGCAAASQHHLDVQQ